MKLTLDNADGFSGEVETSVQKEGEGEGKSSVPLVLVEGGQEADARGHRRHVDRGAQ